MPVFAEGSAAGTVDTKEFPSPDKGAVVIVQTLNTLELRNDGQAAQRRRVVSLIDGHSLKCVFAFNSLERNTLAFWNPSGSRCLILDAPDNGNTFLHLVSKAGKQWNQSNLDSIMDELGQIFSNGQAKGKISNDTLYRGGPTEDGIKWKSDNVLEIKTQDATGYHLFRILVAPDGKSFTRTMKFLDN